MIYSRDHPAIIEAADTAREFDFQSLVDTIEETTIALDNELSNGTSESVVIYAAILGVLERELITRNN